ncbi:hypothetical protein RF11_04116 [Thelohanellus kitauei]|uniref:Uncharacterized protein n=1 Tax=Thelohanellus kitauei TaxID=669202 RepID=A0A0C2J9L8_THEKT|nr:hypothetical protein RF11_04116 [Thelohanellus kitauei]
MTTIGGGYEIDRVSNKSNARPWLLRFDTVAAANMSDAAKQCLRMPAYFDEELLDSYSKSEIFLMPPSEKKRISQREKDFMVREKIYQFLPVAVANQILLFGEMEVKEVCAKADLLLGPTLSTNAISAESESTPEAEGAAIKSNIDSPLSVEERL